jgi:NAD(P)-dependent dehydrogenase (short-subunit alcohol dehydrogenase family)
MDSSCDVLCPQCPPQEISRATPVPMSGTDALAVPTPEPVDEWIPGEEMKAILTGHSRGLGAAIAAELMQRGVAVMGLARRDNPELQLRYPRLLQQHAIDLADGAGLADWLKRPALTEFVAGDQPLLLINNAATVQPMGDLTQQCARRIAEAVMLNVGAPLMLSAQLAALAANAPRRECRILHLSSGAARQAYPGWAVYCAGKAALDHHARAVAADAGTGLRICSLAPGVIDTDMQAELRAGPPEDFALREMFLSLRALGQLATPAACAVRVVDFLLSAQFGLVPTASDG